MVDGVPRTPLAVPELDIDQLWSILLELGYRRARSLITWPEAGVFGGHQLTGRN